MWQVIQFNVTKEKRQRLSQLTIVCIFQYDQAPALTAKFIQYHISSHSLYSSNTAFIPLVQASAFSHSLSPSLLLLTPSFSSSRSHSLFLCPPEMFSPQNYMADLIPCVTPLGRPSLTFLIKDASPNHIILSILLHNMYNHLRFLECIYSLIYICLCS